MRTCFVYLNKAVSDVNPLSAKSKYAIDRMSIPYTALKIIFFLCIYITSTSCYNQILSLRLFHFVLISSVIFK